MDFEQDDDGDLVVTNNNLVFVIGAQDARQRIIQRLRTVRGEWFLDRRMGVPYFENVFQKKINPAIVASVIQAEIVSTPGVIELQSFDGDLDSDRTLSIRLKARVTQNEIIEIETEIP